MTPDQSIKAHLLVYGLAMAEDLLAQVVKDCPGTPNDAAAFVAHLEALKRDRILDVNCIGFWILWQAPVAEKPPMGSDRKRRAKLAKGTELPMGKRIPYGDGYIVQMPDGSHRRTS